MYEYYNENLINFKNNIEDDFCIEIIVGFLEEDLKLYKQINYSSASLGEMNLEPNKGYIIKIPTDFNKELYDYSIIIQSDIDIQIYYDKNDFAVPNTKEIINFFPIIPLFNCNPYLSSSNNKDSNNDKSFYITIYNNRNYKIRLNIQKPKLFLELKLNSTNILPELKDENQNYYYRIPIPKGEYNSLIVQYIIKDYREVGLSLTKKSYEFCYFIFNRDFFNIPINKEEINEDNSYLNLYGSTSSKSYINIIEKNEFYFGETETSKFYFFIEVEQINNKNKLNITFHSYSYYSGKKPCKYYLLINSDLNFFFYVDFYDIYSYIYGKSFNTSNSQIVLDFEDYGLKEIIQYELDIPIDLKEDIFYGNSITILYFDEETLTFKFFDSKYFHYINYKEENKKKKNEHKLLIILIISGVLLLFLIIFTIVFIRRKKRKSGDNDLTQKVLNNELEPIEQNN